MSLILYNTNFKQLDGNGPEAIDLRRAKTIIGRGSQTFPVDAAIFARRNGADIISRRHVEITRSASDVFTITDLMAVNGTFVNSIRLVASQDLNNGDIIQFGGLTSVMTGPDGFCVKYIFRGIGSSSSGQNTKVVSKKAELSKKKVTKKNAKAVKKESTEVVGLSNSNSDYRSKKRVRIDVTNGSNNGTHGSNGNVINVDNTDENQNMEDKLRIEIEALRKEMIEMKKIYLESRISVPAAVPACKPDPGSVSAETVTGTGTETVNTTVNETSQKLGKKNLPLSCGSAKKATEKTTEKNDKTNTPRKKGGGSGEDIVQHSTTIKTPKEKEIFVKKEKEAADRKENSTSRAKESSSRTEYSLMTQSSNSNTTMKCNSSSSGCAIDISSLRSVLTCAICSMVLLDAVVVPCSHGVSTLHTVHHTCTPLLNSYFVILQ
jgi:pSer/pThr/pTyr-binding forkhead associated (FHA) protein